MPAKKSDKKWMQKVSASIKRRGTEGKCTPITKPGCTGRAKALAKTFKKISKNNFDLEDFLSQLQQIKKMGNVKDLMSMIPGVGNKIKDLEVDENVFKNIECIIQSMTPQERQDPDLINNSRKARIVKGSGKSIQELNKLLTQFNDMKKMMKSMNSMKMKR
jgi:signal recognition particle subunit SRP54